MLEEQDDLVAARIDRADEPRLRVPEADAPPAAIHALAEVGISTQHGFSRPRRNVVQLAVLSSQVGEHLGCGGVAAHGCDDRPVHDDVKQVVAKGYDAIADEFAEWQRGVQGSQRLERLDDLLRRLPLQPDVLELGSGAGVRSTRILAERGRLTGVDISGEQVRRARERVPEARFVQADVMEVEFAEGTFDAVVSFYVLNNLPRDELGPLLERIHRWLRPGGWFLSSFPTGDNPGWRGEWLGVEMFFSGYDIPTTVALVRQAGFEVVEEAVETMIEPGYGEGRWLWVLARKGEPG